MTDPPVSPFAPTSIAEFEQQYAERSGVTVEWLHAHGRDGDVCDCGDDICDGFQMRHRTGSQNFFNEAGDD